MFWKTFGHVSVQFATYFSKAHSAASICALDTHDSTIHVNAHKHTFLYECTVFVFLLRLT